jgi:hypothetical protein
MGEMIKDFAFAVIFVAGMLLALVATVWMIAEMAGLIRTS